MLTGHCAEPAPRQPEVQTANLTKRPFLPRGSRALPALHGPIVARHESPAAGACAAAVLPPRPWPAPGEPVAQTPRRADGPVARLPPWIKRASQRRPCAPRTSSRAASGSAAPRPAKNANCARARFSAISSSTQCAAAPSPRPCLAPRANGRRRHRGTRGSNEIAALAMRTPNVIVSGERPRRAAAGTSLGRLTSACRSRSTSRGAAGGAMRFQRV